MIIKNTLIYSVGSLLINGFNFLLIPLYTSYLTTEEYGILSSTNIFTLLLSTILGMGLSAAAVRYYFDFKDQNDLNSYLFSIGLGLLGFALIISIFLSFTGVFLFDNLFKSIKFYPYLLICIWIAFFNTFSLLCLSIYQAKSKALTYRTFTTINFILLNIFMVVFIVVLKWGIMGVLTAQLANSILMGIIYITIFFREVRSNKFDFKYIKSSLIFGIPLMIYALLGYSLDFSSRYFIERFLGLSSLGVFNLALQYSSVINILISSINMAWVPIFYNNASEITSRKFFAEFATNYVSIISAIAVCISLFSKEIIACVTPVAYHDAINIIPLLVISYVIGNGLWVLLVNPISFLKKNYILLFVNAVTVLISHTLNMYLIPIFGLVGAVLSLLLSYSILICITISITAKIFHIPYNYKKIISILLLSILIQISPLYFTQLSNYDQVFLKISLISMFLLIISKFGFSLSFIKSIVIKQ